MGVGLPEPAYRSRFQTGRCCCTRKDAVVNNRRKGIRSGCQVGIEEMSESKPSDDASLGSQGTVKTGAGQKLWDKSGR